MQTPIRHGLVAGAFLALAVGLLGSAPAVAGETHRVEKTHDGRPFDYTMQLAVERDTYRVYRLSYPSPVATPHGPNNTVPADYYLPKGLDPGGPKRPAVVCLHILNGNFELVRMLCASLASRGVPAVMFKLPYYGERSLPGGHDALLKRPELFLGALPQGIADVRRTVDVLASRDEVDREHIGIAGISLGGLLGATAAAEDPRISRAALILAGGNLPKIIDTADEARDLKEALAKLDVDRRREYGRAIAAIDPLTHAASLRGRAQKGRVLMFNGTEDRVIPRPCAEQLAAALGISDRVVWLDGLGHYTAMAALPEVMSQTVAFFAADLPPGVTVESPGTGQITPTAVVAEALRQMSVLISQPPGAGRCHLVDFTVKATAKDGKLITGSAQLVRGHGKRFRLRVDVDQPLGIHASLGDDGAPWLNANGKMVYRGTLGPADPPPALDPAHLLKLRVVAGALGAAAMAPNLLDGLVTVAPSRPIDGAPAIEITSRKDPKDRARLVLAADGRTVRRIDFDVDGIMATITIRAWQLGTVARDELFEPPSGVPVHEVARADVYRMFVSMFNFAMEKAQ